MNVIKRNGSEVQFDPNRIAVAIGKANTSVDEKFRIPEDQLKSVVEEVTSWCRGFERATGVEEIQDKVQNELADRGFGRLAMSYAVYRYSRTEARKRNTTDNAVLALVECQNEEVKQENSNKNPVIASTQRDYMAGEVSKDLTRRVLLPKDIVEAHDKGLIHFHDADYYSQHIHNCCLVNLNDMLQNGTVISGTMIEKPHSFLSACNIATQIVAQVASCQYGGQSISLTHLAPFVEVSRQKIRKQVEEETNGLLISGDDIERMVAARLRREIAAGIQTIQYQILTLQTTNGQTPFVTVYMYLGEATDPQTKADLALIIEETLKQRIQGVKNEAGVYVTPAFPKLIYTLEEDNITENAPYWYLTELAAKCTAKRLVPDYISEKKMKEYKLSKGEEVGHGDTYTCMGCRSFLTPDRSGNGFNNVARAKDYDPTKPKYYGRFNQGVVTIDLPYVALEAGRDLQKFWTRLDEVAELCHRALRCRHERLLGTLSDTSPIHWQYGALARLNKGEKIDKLLYGGYSTISLGYAGLWECVRALIDKKLNEPEGEELGLKIMQKLNEYTAKWKAAEDIDYSIYGTPIESVTYKFAKALQRDFGIIPDVSDKNYITNSYHYKVTEKVTAFEKLAGEAKFQKLSPGGAISYVEVPDLQKNVGAVLSIMKFIYDNIMYAELNTKSDYCECCGFDGEIKIVKDDNGKLVWECPNCGNRDQSKMSVVRRTCGYLGSNYWNQGRTQEIKDRVLHVD